MKIYFSLATVCFLLIFFSCGKNKETNNTKPVEKPQTNMFSIYKINVKPDGLSSVLRLPGELIADQSVNIYPKVNGYIKKILVDIGTSVHEGQVLMIMEAPEIEQNSIAAQARYYKALAALNASKDNYFRMRSASRTLGAVSPNDLQVAQSRMQSDSALCNSEKANWKSVEVLKNYLIVRAPFDGTITQRNIDPGALVTGGSRTDSKPLLELKQISKLRLQVQIPESNASQLLPNQKINFTAEALEGRTFQGVISRKANSLDDKYRSETVELDVKNPDKLLMPGMYVEVILPLSGHQNTCIVPQTAVVTSTERKYIIKVVDHKAEIIDIHTGNEYNGMIEVFGNISAKDKIIANANEEIKQDQAI